MFADANQVPEGSELQADLCIIGGGPAGISMARRLARTSLRVCLLESGGLEEEAETQTLAAGELTGLPYYRLDETRFRVFGGSSNRWGGWCRPLDQLDMEKRPWVPGSGWPINRDDLDPYYREAARLCQLEHDTFQWDDWSAALPDLYRPPFVGEGVRATIWQGSPSTKFGVVYREEVRRASNLTAYLHSNALELEAGPGGHHVTGVRVGRLGGGGFRVRARAYVLAAGAIETARLLLASNRVRSEGLGNGSGMVGRCFMEHPHLVTGRMRLLPRAATGRPLIPAVDRALGGAYARINLQRPAGSIKCAYTIHPQLQRREGLLNFSAHLTTGSYQRREESEVYRSLKVVAGNLRSLRRLGGQIRHRTLPAGLGSQLRNIVFHLDEVARIVVSEVLRRPRYLELYTQAEQAPNPDSRVTLAGQRDPLGMPRVRLAWRLSELDKASIRRSQEILGGRLEKAGLGRLEPEKWLLADDDNWGAGLHGGHHQLGTARMSDDPGQGVVDRHGRLHEVDNLYVADGSVFPTAGYANPLLTVVALALRAADHLQGELGR